MSRGGRPLLSVIIPSCGRPTLARTLASIAGQASPSELEIVVVGDTHDDDFAADLAAVPALCRGYAARYVEHDGNLHAWGQMQRQYGADVARGEWLAFSQDDGEWLPGAWAAIRASVADGEPGPHLFKVSPRPGCVVWDTRELTAGHVDADCLVTPNDPARLGTWAPAYNGDAAMIAETVGLWGGRVVWEEAMIARGHLRAGL